MNKSYISIQEITHFELAVTKSVTCVTPPSDFLACIPSMLHPIRYLYPIRSTFNSGGAFSSRLPLQISCVHRFLFRKSPHFRTKATAFGKSRIRAECPQKKRLEASTRQPPACISKFCVIILQAPAALSRLSAARKSLPSGLPTAPSANQRYGALRRFQLTPKQSVRLS